MSRTSKMKKDMTMEDFFRTDNKAERQGPKLVDYGFGDGIGPILGVGTFHQYSRNLYKQKELGNAYLGKEIDEDKVPMSINNQTTRFNLGDTPIFLVNMNNIIKNMPIKVKWMNADNNVIILESYYQIPSPYVMGLSWWDIYSSYFIGPKLEREGKYTVTLEIDNRKSQQELPKDLISSMEFTASSKNPSDTNININMNTNTNTNTPTNISILNSTSHEVIL